MQTQQIGFLVQAVNHPKTINIRQTVNLLFSASDSAELRRNSIALIEIDKITVEPFFKSCQPENLWGLWGRFETRAWDRNTAHRNLGDVVD